MHGKGLYTWPNHQSYEGQYKKDVRDGVGTFKWSTGMKYIGEWKDNKRHGKGAIKYTNGTQRVGLWQNDRRVSWQEMTLAVLSSQGKNPKSEGQTLQR